MIKITDASKVRERMLQNDDYMERLRKEVEKVSEAIDKAASQGKTDTCFNVKPEFEDKVRDMFAIRGYKFKPTGVIGGVVQNTIQICWA